MEGRSFDILHDNRCCTAGWKHGSDGNGAREVRWRLLHTSTHCAAAAVCSLYDYARTHARAPVQQLGNALATERWSLPSDCYRYSSTPVRYVGLACSLHAHDLAVCHSAGARGLTESAGRPNRAGTPAWYATCLFEHCVSGNRAALDALLAPEPLRAVMGAAAAPPDLT